MNLGRAALALAAAAALGAWETAAQTASAPASLAGIVRTHADGTPLARARVQLRSEALPYHRVALTDGSGAFRFDGLPAGSYQVFAFHSGHVLPYAAGGPLRGMSVSVAGGDQRSGLEIRLERAGVIPGRILDEDGTPLPRAEVEALSLRAEPGERPQAVASARTDDRGEFRLSGLPSGQYFVLARDPAFSHVGDASGALTYAPTYYPGVMSAADAQPITVASGAESSRIELRLQLVPPARVQGRITTPDRGAVTLGAFVLAPRDDPFDTALLPAVDLLADGRLAIRDVPPGRYQLRVQGSVAGDPTVWFGSFAVAVNGRDINDVRIVMVRGGTVEGALQPATAAQKRRLVVRAPLADGTSFGDTPGGAVARDASFRIAGVMPGLHFFTVEGLSAPETLSAVVLEGRNVLERPTQVAEAQHLKDLRLVLSPATDVRGIVRGASGQPCSDTLVVTAPLPPSPLSPVNPRVRMTRTDADGRFVLRGLAPGDYRIAALASVDELVARRREWLERVAHEGTTLALTEDGAPPLDVNVLRAPGAPATR